MGKVAAEANHRSGLASSIREYYYLVLTPIICSLNECLFSHRKSAVATRYSLEPI
jgi:hypothetical protein